MDDISSVLIGAARSALSSALLRLQPGPKILAVDDELFCPSTKSSPFLAMFISSEELRRFHGVIDVVPLSSSKSNPLFFQDASIRTTQAATISNIAQLHRNSVNDLGSVVFLLRPKASSAHQVLHALQCTSMQLRDVLVLVTPRKTETMERIFRASTSLGSIRLESLPIGFLPADDGLLTLFWPRGFSQVVLEGNNSSIVATSEALQSLSDVLNVNIKTFRSAGAAGGAVIEELIQRAMLGAEDLEIQEREFGDEQIRADDKHLVSTKRTALDIFSLGSQSDAASADVENLLPWFQNELTMAKVIAGSSRQHGSDVDNIGMVSTSHSAMSKITLVALDRNVDLVTPLLTQWTYEGLLDEAVALLRGNIIDASISDFVSEDAASMLAADIHEEHDGLSFQGKNSQMKLSHPAHSDLIARNKRVRKRLTGSEDVIFSQLRDLNYWPAARLLGTVASSVQAYYDARPGRETAEISQMKDYVRGLRGVKNEHRSAALHTALAAEISARTLEKSAFKRRFELEREMLEGSAVSGRRGLVHDFICRNEPLPHVLRLCCLWSLTAGGVDAEAFDFIRREIVATYGLSVLTLLGNLERAGLFTRSGRGSSHSSLPWNPFAKFAAASGEEKKYHPSGNDKGSLITSRTEGTTSSPTTVVGYSWQFVRAAMRLMVDFNPDSNERAGLAGPYAGYIPLTVRLLEAGVSELGWSKLPRTTSHTLLLPPGHQCVDHSAKIKTSTQSTGRSGAAESRASIDGIVVFVGGIARAEASAVRTMASKLGKNILIAATEVYGGDQFVSMR